jgi:cytochrome c553
MLALVTTAAAQQRVAIPVSGELQAVLALPGDATRGADVFKEECQACHRSDASGNARRAIPRLAGQQATVVLKQVFDIRSGGRINSPMKAFVEDPALSLQHVADIAAQLQSLSPAGIQGQRPGAGLQSGLGLCERDRVACHGAPSEGRADLFHPRLATQHCSDLLREPGLIRDGGRGNSNPAMVPLVKAYTPEQMQDVADHLSRLPAPWQK